jgi:hypothetical protein
VPPHVFALDGQSLVYGRFVRGESGFDVEDFARADLPEGFFGEGPLGGPMHDPGLFKPLVREIVELVSGGVGEASLVLPDAWLRVAFAEIGELPSRSARRNEILRWKLKHQVPFRVEDLRLQGVEVEPLPRQAEKHRLLLGFGIEQLLKQVEEVFAECGVHLGQVLNASLATVHSIREIISDLNLTALMLATQAGYSLTFTRNAEPLLHRFRAMDTRMGDEAAARLVLRDLKLTRTFLSDQLPDTDLDRVLLISAAQQRTFWLDSLEQGLGRPPVALGREQLPLQGQLPDVSPSVLAPMLGAACTEVA